MNYVKEDLHVTPVPFTTSVTWDKPFPESQIPYLFSESQEVN